MPGHSKMKKNMNKPRFEVSPPPPMPKMMKRRGGKNLMPKAVRRNVKIH